MPLNYDLSKIKSYKRLITKEGQLKEPYSTIILLTMGVVGMRTITEENYGKFYNRLHLIETLNGCFFFTDNRKPIFITKEQVKRMIGLKTNASDLTTARFIKSLVDNYFEVKNLDIFATLFRDWKKRDY